MEKVRGWEEGDEECEVERRKADSRLNYDIT
jgi:hypothetical protein